MCVCVCMCDYIYMYVYYVYAATWYLVGLKLWHTMVYPDTPSMAILMILRESWCLNQGFSQHWRQRPPYMAKDEVEEPLRNLLKSWSDFFKFVLEKSPAKKWKNLEKTGTRRRKNASLVQLWRYRATIQKCRDCPNSDNGAGAPACTILKVLEEVHVWLNDLMMYPSKSSKWECCFQGPWCWKMKA